MDAYIYQAALWCTDCAAKIMADLMAKGKRPENYQNEDTYDSDDYPKGPYADGGGESDNVEHCDGCNVALENPLTEDGRRKANDGKMDCIVDGAAGIYVPQQFANRYDMDKWHVKPDDAEILEKGPSEEYYWDVWDEVCEYAYLIAPNDGQKWTLYQDGDLFAVRHDFDWDAFNG